MDLSRSLPYGSASFRPVIRIFFFRRHPEATVRCGTSGLKQLLTKLIRRARARLIDLSYKKIAEGIDASLALQKLVSDCAAHRRFINMEGPCNRSLRERHSEAIGTSEKRNLIFHNLPGHFTERTMPFFDAVLYPLDLPVLVQNIVLNLRIVSFPQQPQIIVADPELREVVPVQDNFIIIRVTDNRNIRFDIGQLLPGRKAVARPWIQLSDVSREVEDGFEMVKLHTPCVVTFIKPNFDLRFATIRGKLAANRATIPVLGAEDIPMDLERAGLKGSPTKVKSTFTPEVKTGGMIIHEGSEEADAAKLAELLCGANII